MKILETERLVLREVRMSDLEDMYRTVYGNPEVVPFWTSKLRTLEETRDRLARRIQSSEGGDGFGSWAIVRRDDNTLLGLIDLISYRASYIVFQDAPDSPYHSLEVEMSYALGREYWGQGYATEAGKSVINYAFEDLRLRRLVNSVHSENIRSVNLMKRLGFRIEKNLHPNFSGRLYGILDNTPI